ncbi:MAG: triosephosphate isomerase [Pseudomonadota bacterium]|jgi:triosephosphate isomerase
MSKNTTKYVIGNWKMNSNWETNANLLNGLKANLPQTSQSQLNNSTKTIVCVPYIYIVQCKGLLNASTIEYGAQDVSIYENGAYTGDISASMLVDLGCKYVIIGHSERRTYYKESDELFSKKVEIALKHGLIPVLCVGETLEQREANITNDVVKTQLETVLKNIKNSEQAQNIDNIIIAYEPVWAIGTGKTATSEQAQAVHAYLREIAKNYMSISPSILYGGSVKANNAKELFDMQDIDGGLIGGASLVVDDFCAIIKSASY